MRNRILSVLCLSIVFLVGLLGPSLVSSDSASAAVISGGKLVSGTAKPVNISVPGNGIQFNWSAVSGAHVTFAITNPSLSPASGSMALYAYNPNGTLGCSVAFSISATGCNFTPSGTGPTTVVITGYGGPTTGTFTLTYATDVTGTLASGVAVTPTIKYEGQHALYNWSAVSGAHVTFAITNPSPSPLSGSMTLTAYNPNGTTGCSVTFTMSATECDFAPSSTGPATAVISGAGTTIGTFTLTYATDVTGTLASGVAVTPTIKYEGQHALYNWSAVSGAHVTFAITNPSLSPASGSMALYAYNPNGTLGCSVAFSISATGCNFTPSGTGPTTVVITGYGGPTTGTFTLTYATDVTGTLASGVAVTPTIKYEGQHALYNWSAVSGAHVTFAITNPSPSPLSGSMTLTAYNPNGTTGCSVTFTMSATECDFAPSSTGPATAVISGAGTTIGTFTLTYATDVTGTLASGVAVTPTIKYEGQHALYNWSAVSGAHVTFAITNPSLSPASGSMALYAYNPNGTLGCSVAFSISATGCNFTPSGTGPTTVVITGYGGPTTGTFTLTYTGPGSPPPTTSVLIPANGATLSGTSAALDASASNASSVEFWLLGGSYGSSGHLIGTATSTNYGWLYSWNTTTVPNSSYVLESEAFNSSGHAFSAGVTITVNNLPPPTTSVILPSNGATLSGTASLLDATASNATSVEFLLLGGSYGFSGHVVGTATLTSFGWVYSWNTNTVANGSYVLLSEASNANASAFSPGVNITVKN